MRVLVPFDVREPKTRLSAVFTASQRASFARIMLTDVLSVLQQAGHDPTVVSTAELSCECPVRVDQRPLSDAINGAIEAFDVPLAVVMADLPLLTVETVERLFDASGDVVIAPGLGGGTNALVVRIPEFRVDYHGASFQDHCAVASTIDASCTTVDSFRLALDIDRPDDLIEVLLHGEFESVEWLIDEGFELDTSGQQPKLLQSGESI